MSNLETLREEDKALTAMYQEDKDTLTPEDKQAFQELIEGQRSSHMDTQAEIRDETGKTSEVAVKSIGDAALHNPQAQSGMAVHSKGWRTDEK